MTDLNVLYEDNHLIAVYKTNHDLVQSDGSADIALEEKVKEYIKKKYKKPGNVFLGVAHRLDRPVSGIVLFARTSKALARINEMFRDNKIKKIYWAIVKNKPEHFSGNLVHYIARNVKQNKSYCYDKEVPDSKKAELAYTLIASSERYHLIEIDLKTGRHHQIRAQLSAIGCPVKGDLKYGFPRSNPDGGISLHARSLTLLHPVTKDEINIVTEPPEVEVLWSKFTR